jgi:mono/diheme cytochrome c family protein
MILEGIFVNRVNRLLRTLPLAAVGLSSALLLRESSVFAATAQNAAEADASYKPAAAVFQANCARCHSGMKHRGGFSIDSRESMLRGGKDGPAIVPG